MICKRLLALGLAVVFGAVCTPALVLAQDYKLEKVDKVPDAFPKAIAGALDPSGVQLVGPDGVVCAMWVRKTIPAKADFSPTLNIHYPLAPGQLVGAMWVPEDDRYTDFRGQEFDKGVYTLRYGQQPVDGNHIGTSETYDFLLALVGKDDDSTKPIGSQDQLSNESAEAVGSTHPAILSLLPPDDVQKSGVLTHDEDRDYWLLDLVATAEKGGKVAKLPMRLVVVGRALE